MKTQDWLTLDNAAKIYPAVSSRKSPTQFRLSATLTKPINFCQLQSAWKKMIERCPYFQVYLQRGFFWYFLQRHNNIPPIEFLDDLTNITFNHRSKFSHLIKIGVKDSTIAIDFSHILADGTGGLRFLLALLYTYFELQEYPEEVPNPNSKLDPAEFEDSFHKHFPGKITSPQKLSAAYHIAGQINTKRRFTTLTGKIPIENLNRIVKEANVTITEFLTTVYFFSLKEMYLAESIQKKQRHSIIRLQIPVNIRKILPSKTMRNFALYVSPEIDLKLGVYNFREILQKVHHSMKLQVDQKELVRQVSRNVGGEINPFVRSIPLFIKDLYLSGLYRRLGEKCYSGVLSNLGKISVPKPVENYIQNFNFSIMPNSIMKKSCTVLSYRQDLIINFCSMIQNTDLERVFFTKLVEMGIPVLVKEE